MANISPNLTVTIRTSTLTLTFRAFQFGGYGVLFSDSIAFSSGLLVFKWSCTCSKGVVRPGFKNGFIFPGSFLIDVTGNFVFALPLQENDFGH